MQHQSEQEVRLQESESSSSDSSLSELNVSSSSFNPLRALYSPDFPLVKSAPVLDNVEKFVSVHEGKRSQKGKKKNEITSSTPSSSMRFFLPEQMPIVKPKKDLPNVLLYMKKQTSGPMSMLAKCVANNGRVKVYTRSVTRIRGYCIGFLFAFDKHWNLALVDVDEVFSRKRRPKAMLLEENRNKKNKDKRGIQEQVGLSSTVVIKKRRKTELCQRHIPQMVLRGEHVVSVCILHPEEERHT